MGCFEHQNRFGFGPLDEILPHQKHLGISFVVVNIAMMVVSCSMERGGRRFCSDLWPRFIGSIG